MPSVRLGLIAMTPIPVCLGAVLSAAVRFCSPGMVRTSVIVTGVQVFSRIFMVWFIASSIRQVTVALYAVLCLPFRRAFPFCLILQFLPTRFKIQNEESVILFLLVWTLTEITRYSYYTFKLLRHLPFFIKWARWSNWCRLCVFACCC